MTSTQFDFSPGQTWLTRGGWVERIKSVHSFMAGKPITCASGRLYNKEGRFLRNGRDSEHDLIEQIDLDGILSQLRIHHAWLSQFDKQRVTRDPDGLLVVTPIS